MFIDCGEAELLLASKKVAILEELGDSTSDGQLDKWKVSINGIKYYLKASSIVNGMEMYECESECIACRIAELMGIENVVRYDLDYIEYQGNRIKVCVSQDFADNKQSNTYYRLIKDIAKYKGKEKYDRVVEYNKELREQLDRILFFDAIILNSDRHLNNLEVVLGEDGTEFLPLFDNGAALFSNVSDRMFKMLSSNSLKYHSCKPFYNTIGQQLSLLGDVNLDKVNIHDVFDIVDMYLNGKRSKLVKNLLYSNLSELNMLRWNYV